MLFVGIAYQTVMLAMATVLTKEKITTFTKSNYLQISNFVLNLTH